MRVLDMTQPIGLDDIYTSVNILEKITGRRRLEIAELLYDFSSENFERFSLSRVREERIPGLDAVNKYSSLMILGKPGAGKTTFLKYLALQCIEGRFQATLIPFFITLKDFAEAPNNCSLLDYLIQIFANYGVAPNTKIKSGILKSLLNWNKTDRNQLVDLTSVEELLNRGKLLMLLDGLDEVKEVDSKLVLQKIRDFTTQFHQNQFVITCRIAAREYIFEQFTEVEIADFDFKQIVSFINKWFRVKDDLVKAEQMCNKLEQDKPIQELATSPLLLTLLCLVFEESGNFPTNRSELYKEGLDILLKKWDAKRNIERDQVYKKLSLKRKEDLLSQIAIETFEQGDYFFKQKDIERHITQYISNLPEASTDLEALQLDSEVVLKSIEAQHGLLVERARGIYSFSHLTFHEYFTAREIVSPSKPNAEREEMLQALAANITDKRWWEVFLLTVGMLGSADSLLQLMEHQIDRLLADDEKLQKFLTWVERKARSVTATYKISSIRAFYFNIDFDLDLEHDLTFAPAPARGLDRILDRALNIDRAFNIDRILDRVLERALERTLDLARVLDRDLDRDLEHDRTLNRDIALDRVFERTLNRDLVLASDIERTVELDLDRDLVLAFDLALALNLDLDRALDPIPLRARNRANALKRTIDRACARAHALELQHKLQELKQQLPDITQGLENLLQWWQAKGQAWTKQLRTVIIEHRNICHDWQFNDSQMQLLQQYYEANKFLLDCLNSECYVSRPVRQKIEDTLLLPYKPSAQSGV